MAAKKSSDDGGAGKAELAGLVGAMGAQPAQLDPIAEGDRREGARQRERLREDLGHEPMWLVEARRNYQFVGTLLDIARVETLWAQHRDFVETTLKAFVKVFTKRDFDAHTRIRFALALHQVSAADGEEGIAISKIRAALPAISDTEAKRHVLRAVTQGLDPALLGALDAYDTDKLDDLIARCARGAPWREQFLELWRSMGGARVSPAALSVELSDAGLKKRTRRSSRQNRVRSKL